VVTKAIADLDQNFSAEFFCFIILSAVHVRTPGETAPLSLPMLLVEQRHLSAGSSYSCTKLLHDVARY
jgi:hypothetical protein